MTFLRWISDQPLLVQYALLLPPIGIGGVLLWSAFGKQGRLERRATRAAARARAAAAAEGIPIRDHWARGALDVSPGSLAITYFVVDDATVAAAEASGAAARLRERTLQELRALGYPAEPSWVELLSDETVDRAGGPAVYFR